MRLTAFTLLLASQALGAADTPAAKPQAPASPPPKTMD